MHPTLAKYVPHYLQVPGCKIRGCLGNITFWEDEEADLLGFRLNHHKSMWNWGQPIEGFYPKRFTKAVLKPYLQCLRPWIVSSNTVQSFFVNKRGLPFSRTGLTVYYARMWVSLVFVGDSSCYISRVVFVSPFTCGACLRAPHFSCPSGSRTAFT